MAQILHVQLADDLLQLVTFPIWSNSIILTLHWCIHV